MNFLGTVLSSRRSAEITFVDYGTDEWEEFAKFKRNCFEEGFKHKQQSNNSLIFNTKPSRDQLLEVFQMMIDAGGSEPGFYNMDTGRKRAPFATGSNPCGEILLPSKGFCNLVEVDVSKFKGDSARLHQAYHIIARANYRQTCVDLDDGILSESWNTNNKFLRLCGVGATGIASRDDMSDYEIKSLQRSATYAARAMAKELGTEFPKNVTTVKPSGTLGKIMDAGGEGIHKPEGKYLFNWVNFSNHDPLVLKLKEANYRWITNPSDSTGTLICLPVKFEDTEFDRLEVTRKDGSTEILEVNLESSLEQLKRYKKWQVNYCDQNVSNTIYYRPEEKEDIVDWLLDNWEIYVGVSFLFKNDPTVSAADLGFEYLPQEYVTEDTFYKYYNTLEEVDFEGTDIEIEIDDGGCATGACPIK
jgi:ribonucleoside-triphosphate reductase